MTDHFSRISVPRAPWLDLNELKNTYYQKTLQSHPDAQTNHPGRDATDATFTTLNEAYQVLQDPKRRLHHLLSLEGAAPSSHQTVPQHLHDLFPVVGALTQRANLLLEKIGTTSNRLSQSLLKPQILEVQNEAKEVHTKIQSLFDTSLAELQQINTGWTKNPAEQIKALSNLYVALAYLTRWLSQLNEITFQLSLH